MSLQQSERHLRELFGSIVGLPAARVPRHWIYVCRNLMIAEAVTRKNAVEVLNRFAHRLPIRSTDRAWHERYNSKSIREMVQDLANEGYFDGDLN